MEPMIPQKPRKETNMRGRLRDFVSQPYCILGAGTICILLLLLGLSSAILHEMQDGHTIVKRHVQDTTIPDITKNSTTNNDDELMPARLKIDDYWIINNEYAGIVSLESVLCENCSKIIFDKMQIDEIHAFMSSKSVIFKNGHITLDSVLFVPL